MSNELRVRVWRGPDVDFSNKQHAIDTVQFELDRQLQADVIVTTGGAASLDHTPYDNYDDYFTNFKYEEDLQDGQVNVLIYSYSILNALTFSPLRESADVDESELETSNSDGSRLQGSRNDAPVAGFCDSNLDSSSPTMSIVNVDIKGFFGNKYFENMILHEVLHSVLRGENAPERGNEHSFGEQTNAGNSPMLTGYADPISNFIGGNRLPDIICNTSDPSMTIGATTRLSNCTKLEADRYIREEL